MIGACFAPPCCTFSLAACRRIIYRTRFLPWGVSGLPPEKEENVRHGNRLLRTALLIMKWLHQAGIAFCFEHPVSACNSFTPALQKWCDTSGCVVCVLDQCQFGQRLINMTKLLLNHVEPLDAETLCVTCKYLNNVCSSSGRPHMCLG